MSPGRLCWDGGSLQASRVCIVHVSMSAPGSTSITQGLGDVEAAPSSSPARPCLRPQRCLLRECGTAAKRDDHALVHGQVVQLQCCRTRADVGVGGQSFWPVWHEQIRPLIEWRLRISSSRGRKVSFLQGLCSARMQKQWRVLRHTRNPNSTSRPRQLLCLSTAETPS